MVSKSNFKAQFGTLAKKAKKIVITSHYSPDDDSIASILSMYAWLNKRFPSKNISMIVTGNYISRYALFQNFNQIKFVSDLSTELKEVDLLIMLDGSQYSRFTRHPQSISSHHCHKVCIDHHSSPTDKFDLIHLDKYATSTSEIIMDVLFVRTTISPQVAEILLMGILGDTGTFNYLKPNQLHTFDNCKKLLSITNLELQDFKSSYSSIDLSVFTIIQEYMRNTGFVDLVDGNNYQFSFVTREFIDKNDFSDSQISEAGHLYMSNYLRLISNYRWGYILTPKRDEISISLRSLPNSVNVRDIVEKIGIGGGHDRAAGGGFKPEKWGNQLNLDYCLKYITNWLNKNKLILS